MGAKFDEAKLLLARLRIDRERHERDVLANATRISGRTLGVARVGVWFLDETRTKLRSMLLYTTDTDAFVDEPTVLDHVAPSYFAALENMRVIAADDALTHELTRGLAEAYLRPHGIGAMLDAPLYQEGRVVGVVCHEHMGGPRVWTPREIDFACSVADIVSSLYLQHRLREAEQEVQALASARQDAARLAALTAVTRAFAHDVSNALAVSMLAGQQLSASRAPELVQLGEELTRASSFGARVLKDLRSFASRGDEERESIGAILTTFRPVLDALTRDIAERELVVADPELVAAAPRTHVEQIVLNLCLNARDASRTGGKITIAARRAG
ncbi:MAG TPA: GAF domain-containing protein, partial [Kofleriaceae bacterium]|nr:GAF domain-containing protein [Kofleriaceae bacterium]